MHRERGDENNHTSRDIRSSMRARVHGEVVMKGAEFRCPVPVSLTVFMQCCNMSVLERPEDSSAVSLLFGQVD